MIKRTRIVSQCAFLIITLLFSYGVIKNQDALELFYSIHIFPSFAPLGRVIVPGFILVTLFFVFMPLFAGRLYCGFLCPVGFVQDLSGKMSKLFGIEKKRSYIKTNIALFVFMITMTLLLMGQSFHGWVDHYSNFMRLLTVFDSIYSVQFFVALLFLAIITVVSLFRTRWFCANLCPSGGLYSFMNKRTLLKIVGKDDCKKCKRCNVDCPTLCIDDGVVNHAQCVSCFECLEWCNFDTFSLKWCWPFTKRAKELRVSRTKRDLLKGIGVGVLGVASGYGMEKALFARSLANSSTIVPPGAKSLERFMSLCSFCNLCVDACPTKVLVPTYLENGFIGLPKPKMAFPESYCSYECIECLSICPTGAIDYFPLETKKQIKIGSVELNEHTCIPFVNGEDCAACAEHCPTGGVVTENRDGVRVPVINQDYCIGCGACENICPVEPIRAIVVKPEAIHTVAYSPIDKAPPRDGLEDKSYQGDGFPF